MACWDLMGKATNQPIYKLLGGKVRDKIEIAYCFGITDIPTVQKKIQEIKDQGYLAFKTKGGRDVIFDIERTQAIREEAGKSMKLRVDMNQGYSLIDAITYVNGVSDCQLEYLEQPIRVNNIDSLASLRSRSTVPIAINEDCYIPNNFLETIKRNAIDVGVIDLEPLGGITELVKAAHIANEAGIPLAHHCGWDMGIKLAAVLQTVSSLAAFTQPMDSTYMAHADDVLKEKINVINGHYYPSTEPGLGIEVDEEKIAKYAV
jgi:L-alanine-DL-glutamate epimerase-like enolase superfamily enzyme